MACASLIDSISDVDHSILGLLELPLAFNGEKLDSKQEAQARRKLNRRLPLLERELADRPIRHGNRNYVGMLYYILQEKDKAIECWEKTVEEDPTNLNAIKDLCTAYAKLGDLKESRKWQSHLEETQSKLSGNPDDEKRVYGRCRAEQAYAACWDLHTQTWSNGVAQMEKTVKRFESALEYADKLISQDEKEDWHLAIGQAYERLSHRHKRNNNITQYIQSINKAAQHLDFSISSSQHTLHKAEAWGVLGNALTYDSGDKTASILIPNFIKTKYKAYWYKPSLCYDKALSLDPGNAWVLGNYGLLHRKLRNYSAAIEKFDEAIESDPSPSSWLSYDNRSKVYTTLARKTNDKQLKEKYLRQADEDSEMADKSNPNPRSKSQRGEIAHDMAESAGTDQEKKHYSVQALAHFAESLQIQDGMDISDAHLKQGNCLLKRDKWSAVQSYKMAYSTCPPNAFQERIASEFLLPHQLDHYKDEQKPKNLLAELAYWITVASLRHPSSTSIFKILGRLARNRFQNEILEVMEYIVVKQPTVFGVDRMINEGFITLKKTRYSKDNFKRLCNLERQHTTRMHSSTCLDPTTPLPYHQPPEKAKNPKWQNDFYVITPAESYQWVQYFLLPGMECNFFSLKGFYQQRDQVIGKLKVPSQAEAISNSASIVIVYSGSFSDDKECKRLFGTACDTKPASKMALLKLDNTPIAPEMARITQFDFSGSQTQFPPQWFDLAKFLS